MRFALNELRDLIGNQAKTDYGVVVSISSGVAKVATEAGAVFATAGPGVRPGVRVKIQGGTAHLSQGAAAVYQV